MPASFEKFDPLLVPANSADEAATLRRQKRNIRNVLHSYVGWYDPFAELIQNALDAVERRKKDEPKGYTPTVRIVIDTPNNSISVSDNGIGLDEATFKQFLAPGESFKDLDSRGSKGVGATYVAYGFNYLRVDTKTKNFVASGEMEKAREWLDREVSASNPLVFPVGTACPDPEFVNFDRGVSITLKFDNSTQPRDLSWPQLNNAKAWFVALSTRTALGAVRKNIPAKGTVLHIDKDGAQTSHSFAELYYLAPHSHLDRTKKYDDVYETLKKRFAAGNSTVPPSLKNLDAVYFDWDADSIVAHVESLTEEEAKLVKFYNAKVIGDFMYGTGAWDDIAKKIGYRANAGIYGPGIQLATNNMPQGELIQIPLTRYAGRQNQVHILINLEGVTVDLGRKGFPKDAVDFAKILAAKMIRENFEKISRCLRNDDFRKDSLIQSAKVAGWKQKLAEHEKDRPLVLKNDHFFKPVHELSVTAEPSREQDVIALFNQLIAGGVIRGIKIVGTNEMMTYDGAYRIIAGPTYDDHEYDATANPLGIDAQRRSDYEDSYPQGFRHPELKVLEYKFNVDGLITDIVGNDKQASEIDLIVAWEMGQKYEMFFDVRSLLTEDGISDRDYHGLTHKMFDEHGKFVMDAIILRDLIAYLGDPDSEGKRQEELYAG